MNISAPPPPLPYQGKTCERNAFFLNLSINHEGLQLVRAHCPAENEIVFIVMGWESKKNKINLSSQSCVIL